MDTEPKQKTDELPKDTSEDYKSGYKVMVRLSHSALLIPEWVEL
jgi:hypothetical protein